MGDAGLTGILEKYVDDDAPAHEYLRPDGTWESLTYRQLLAQARASAAALTALGLRPGDRVAMAADDPQPFVRTFLGALWAGLVPVPVPAPPLLGRRGGWAEQLATVREAARPALLCLSAAEREAAGPGPLATYEELAAALPDGTGPAPIGPDQVLYLQFSSGTTARPRAVAARAGAVLANGRAIMHEGARVDAATDRALSWLPMHHDMGLVGFLLAPLTAALPVSYLPTGAFVRDPGCWLRAMSERSATITFAPNFAYALAARRATPERVAALDLSRVRVAGCGGEPISAATLRAFTEAHAPAGLRPQAVAPCYGLAESTLAVTFSPPGRPLRTEHLDAGALARGRAEPAGDGPAAEVVGCGRPFAGHRVTVRDEAGLAAADRTVGEVWVRGPSAAREYVGDPEAGGRTFRADGWVRTGDRGYLADGELFVTGRVKDLLVIRGHNTDPQRVEWLVEALPGVRLGGVVACTRPGAETEELVVVAECRAGAAADLPARVRATVSAHLALAVHDVVPVRPGTVPKTTSGKPRRAETRRRYLESDLIRVH